MGWDSQPIHNGLSIMGSASSLGTKMSKKKKARIEPVVEGADVRAAESYGYSARYNGKPLDSGLYFGDAKDAWVRGWIRCDKAFHRGDEIRNGDEL